MSEYIPNKSLGQHWLNDSDTLDAIVTKAEVTANDVVVEIGPGLGTLTKKLLATGAKVIAIEFDDTLLGSLRAKFANDPQFELVHEDVLKYDFSKLPSGYKIVANIPYYLTSQLLRILSDSHNKPHSADLLMQKEVTQRVCATHNNMSILAVAIQSEFAASEGIFVAARMFTPPPKVDSLVLHLELLAKPLVPADARNDFMRIVKAGFSAKRKTLRNTFSSGLHLEKSTVEAMLGSVSIDPQRRAETLSLDEWLQIYQIITKA